MISSVMVIVDVNILLYANDPESYAYFTCRRWVEDALNGREQIGLPWQTLLAFIRLVTDPRVCKCPLSATDACRIVTSWLSRPNVHVIEPGARFWSLFVEQARATQIRGALVPDAALACIALEQGARLCSADRDFSRFVDLQVFNPARRS
jgi:toxin-antitoxin system PIN domain toxin